MQRVYGLAGLIMMVLVTAPVQASSQINSVISSVWTVSAAQSNGKFEPSPLEQLAKKDIKKARRIGQVSGGIIGAGAAILLSKGKGNTLERATYIALGAAAGYKLGDEVGKKIGKSAANRRLQYAAEYEFLDSEIAASEQAIIVRQEGIAQTETQITDTEVRVAELQAKEELTKKDKKKAKKLRKRLKKEIKRNEILLTQYQEKIGYLEHTLATSKVASGATEAEIELHKRKHQSLSEKKETLVAQYVNAEQQGQKMAGDKQILDKLLS